MKKLALVIGCLVPVLSFAATNFNNNAMDSFQEQCAKEKDPVKRQNFCHILDHQSESQVSLPDFHQETAIV